MPITPIILHVDVAPPASIAITTPIGPNYAVYYYTGTITVPDYGHGSVYYFVVGAENFINAIGNEDYAYIYATVDGTAPASFNSQAYCLYPRAFEYYPPLDKYLEILDHGFGAGFIGPGTLTVKIVVYTGDAISGIAPNFNIQKSIPGTLNNLSVGVVAYPYSTPIRGCTNRLATNYNPLATVDDGSCIVPVRGCTNPTATNYNHLATVDDGSCTYPASGGGTGGTGTGGTGGTGTGGTGGTGTGGTGTSSSIILGCTNPLATNYNRLANTDDGSCMLLVRGCKDPTATNYNPAATIDDGSCVFPLVLPPHLCPVILTPAIPVGSWEVGQRTLPFLSDYPATSLPTLFARNEVFPTRTRLTRLDAAEEGGDPSLPAWMDGSGKQSGLTYSLLRSFYDMLTGARLRLPFERLEQCCGLSDLSTNGLAPRRAFVLDAADPGLNALSWDSGDAGTTAAMGTVIRRAQSLWDLLTAFDPVFLPTGTGALVLRNLDPLVSTGACPDEAVTVIDVTLESLSDSALIPAALCSRRIPSGLDLSDGTLSAGGTVALFLQ